eukprot:c20456_g1_i1.p2 GENE.c20456_g1_i1~~c20456_g1_i1.p2  ORF type:complete len:204 (-),score=55.36 c20456_g1_i1:76-687(-)
MVFFFATFVLVALTYVLLTCTALFAFSNIDNDKCKSRPGPPCKIQDLFTENFSSYNQRWLASYLTLFPVFTLSSNFPLISITLRNNIITLFQRVGILNGSKWQHYLAAFITPCPPIILAFIVHDVSVLVGFTGSYAGTFIMFILPACLVRSSRKQLRENLRLEKVPQHDLTSPFQSDVWIWVILAWAAISLVVITVNNIMKLT